jgi:hypothetical protein
LTRGDESERGRPEVAPPHDGAEGRRARSLWLVLLVCALFTLLLTAVFGYLALGPVSFVVK